MSRFATQLPDLPPLERFLRDYTELRQGAWDEIEPQVYDVLMDEEVLRVTFDPEALVEHPAAQLASAGSPLVDRLLADARQRWSFARLHRLGLNLHPHNLEARLRRTIALADKQTLQLDRVRPLNFTQAVYWFTAEFISDQREQEVLCVGADLHHLREVRHLDRLLDLNQLSDAPVELYADARRASTSAGYRLARDSAVRTLGTLANTRAREIAARVDRQAGRMQRYYDQLLAELDERARREGDTEAESRLASRKEAVVRERQLRIAEVRQKGELRVRLELTNLLLIQQPKLLMHATLAEHQQSAAIEIVWDPLTDAMEAVACPKCRRPGFAFRFEPRAGLGCADCVGTAARR
ncbi:MAG: hypothetical protein ACHRHE_04890 [Tepidisphaerales bacterium]